MQMRGDEDGLSLSIRMAGGVELHRGGYLFRR